MIFTSLIRTVLFHTINKWQDHTTFYHSIVHGKRENEIKQIKVRELENLGNPRTHSLFYVYNMKIGGRRNSKEHQNQRVSLSLCHDGEVSRWFIINAGLKSPTLKRRSWRGGKSCIFHEVQPALVAVPEVALELVEPAEHLVTAGIK